MAGRTLCQVAGIRIAPHYTLARPIASGTSPQSVATCGWTLETHSPGTLRLRPILHLGAQTRRPSHCEFSTSSTALLGPAHRNKSTVIAQVNRRPLLKADVLPSARAALGALQTAQPGPGEGALAAFRAVHQQKKRFQALVLILRRRRTYSSFRCGERGGHRGVHTHQGGLGGEYCQQWVTRPRRSLGRIDGQLGW